jgi:hypothetical protein
LESQLLQLLPLQGLCHYDREAGTKLQPKPKRFPEVHMSSPLQALLQLRMMLVKTTSVHLQHELEQLRTMQQERI